MAAKYIEGVDKELLVDVNPYRTRVVLMENGSPVEFYMEGRGNERLVGNIYKGRVQNVLPGMFAAFVNINEEKNAFLYAGDIRLDSSLTDGEQIDMKASPSTICDVVRAGQDIMVQIVKEPIGTKGARASTHITLPGHTLVFMPGVDFVGISKRITNEAERERLKGIIDEYKPEGTGVIVRTAAEGLDDDDIREDLLSLVSEWELIKKRYMDGRAPKLIHKEDSLISRTVRDMLKTDVRRLVVNDKKHYDIIKELVEESTGNSVEKVELYGGQNNMFERFGVENAIDSALSRKVWLKSGAYIVIDRTEALTCIDVNTGKYVGSSSLQRTIADTNREAAIEIARQLRLRDIGGIIIIDFIDMEDKHDRETVLETLRDALKKDRTKSVVLGMTELGLVQVTRKKLREGISSLLQTVCPYCNGDGRVRSSETIALKVRSDLLTRISDNPDVDEFIVYANPEVIRLMEEHSEEEYSLNPLIADKSVTWKATPAMHIEEYRIKNI